MWEGAETLQLPGARHIPPSTPLPWLWAVPPPPKRSHRLNGDIVRRHRKDGTVGVGQDG